MKKILRFMLMGTLMLFAGQTMAEDVTLDFDTDYQTLFPTIGGVSSGTGDSYVPDGEFSGVTTSTVVGGVTVTVSPAEDAKTPSRIWASSPRLRMYSGTFTVSGTDITKIVFNSGSNFSINTATGTLSDKTWTGEKCSEVVFNVEKNTQLKSIVVTLGEGGGEVTPPAPVEENITVASALAIIATLDDGKTTSETYNVKGVVVGDPDFQRNNSGNLYGNVNFTMGDNASDTNLLTVFRAKYFGNVSFTEETISELKAGDEVILSGKLQKYVKDGVTTPELTQGAFTSINGKTGDDTPVDPITLTGDGTLENPYTAKDATAVATQLGSGNTTTESYYIKGKVSKITYLFSAQYGTATFFISADGSETDQFQIYSTYYLANRAWADGDTQIALGDEVIVYGKITNYQGTPETASKQSYIYSLNGVTEAGEVVIPEPTKVSSIAELLRLNASATNLELTLTDAKVLFNDGNYIYVREGNSALCFYNIAAVKELFKNNAIVSGTIRVDYEVYKLLPEVKANTFTSADGITVEESEEEAEPTQTTLTAVDEGQNVCDLVTLTATLVRKQTYKVGEDGQVVLNEETGEPVISNTAYYLQDEEAEIVVVNNSKNLSKLADEGEIVKNETGVVSTVESIVVTGIVNTNNNAYQVKLTKNAVDPNAKQKGDVNGDKTVDVADISAIISVMAGIADYQDADVNGDGNVDVADISMVISIMAN